MPNRTETSPSAECASDDVIEVTCPCCEGILWIGIQSRSVLRHQVVERRMVAGFDEAFEKLKVDHGRREQAFEKSVAAHKSQSDTLSKKFDELLKIAKDNPNEPLPVRDIDLD